jgi:hypothetical protein
MVEHVDIVDPEIHEPKGVASASVDTVYVADGAGSGTWQKVDEAVLNYSDVLSAIQADVDDGDLALNGQNTFWALIDDVSTASFILVPVLKDCTFKRARLVLGAAINTSDATVTFKNAGGPSMGTATTVAFSGSAEGTGFTFTASSNNTLTGPTYIKIETDGGSTGTAPLYILLEFTAKMN